MNFGPLHIQAVKPVVLFAVLLGISVPLRAIGVAPQQASLGLALIVALYLAFTTAGTGETLKDAANSLTARVFMVLVVAWCITVPFSYDPSGSLKIGGRTILFVLTVTIIWAVLKNHDEVHRLLCKVLVVVALALTVCAALSLAGVPYILSALKLKALVHENPTMSFKAYSAAAMCLIPVVAWAGRRAGHRWQWWGYAFAPLTIATIIMTNNRSALVGVLAMVIAGAFVLALKWKKHTKSLLALMAATVAGVLGWVHTTQSWRESIQGTYLPEWMIDAHRQFIWKFAYQHFLDNPLVGVGLDQLNRIPGAGARIQAIKDVSHIVPSHPHNWFLEILSETGIVGTLPVVLLLSMLAWRQLKGFLQHENDTDLALLTLMAGFWASALFNFSIWAAWWQLTFLTLFAIVSASRMPSEHK